MSGPLRRHRGLDRSWRTVLLSLERRFVTPTISRARQLALTVGALATTAPRRPQPVRIIRWVFSRDSENLTCELRFADDDYELSTIPPYPPSTKGIERFHEVPKAFQRQSEIEGALINDGWRLTLHESVLA